MAGLTTGDLRAVLDFVGEVNEAEGLTEFRVHLLDSLRRLVPADYISFNELEEDGRVLVAVASPEIPEHLLQAWGRRALENPLVRRYARTRDGRPYRFSDVISMRELPKLALYGSSSRRWGCATRSPLPSRRALAWCAGSRSRAVVVTSATGNGRGWTRPGPTSCRRFAMPRCVSGSRGSPAA